MIEIAAALAVLAPVAGGAVAWLAPARFGGRVAAAAFGAAMAGALALVVQTFAGGEITGAGGLVRIDGLGAWILTIVVVVGGLALAASPRYLAHDRDAGADGAGRYYALVLWFLAALVAVPLADSIGLIWVGLEAATIVSALLVGFHRTPTSLEAAWKYLIIGSLGIGFALLGTVLLSASALAALGEVNDALNWSVLMARADDLDPSLVRLAFVFFLVGYGTKAGLAPFHTWLPDAHSQAPSPVSALLSGATLGVGLYALIRVHLVASASVGPAFSSSLLVAFGLITLAVALPFMVAQGDLKRLLAYSSIEHMGLLALAVGFGGPLALLGATLGLLGHALAKATAFVAAGDLVQEQGTRRLGRLHAAVTVSPAAGWPLLAAVLALGGLPPSATFTAELAIVVGGAQQGWLLPAATAALLLGLAFAAVSYHVLRLAWGTPRRPSRDRPPVPLGRGLLLGVPLAVVAVLGVWIPAPLGSAIDAVVAVLLGVVG